MNRRNLIILRAGDASLHKQWIADPERDFDLFISYYGATAGRYQDECEYWEHRTGPKWPCIADLLREKPSLLNQYDSFWFPDDDLAADTITLNRMFALFRGFNLQLAQPALTHDSYFSWSQLLQRPRSVLRLVGFVEVMAPLFTRTSLLTCLASFSESRSGWGLDWVWPKLLGGAKTRTIGIIDATAVKHTRPVGGELYKNNPDLDPRRDSLALVTRYNLSREQSHGKFLCVGIVEEHQLPLWERIFLKVRTLNAIRRNRRRSRLGSKT